MIKFPIEFIKSKKAILNAKIFKNEFLLMPATLFYSIEINLEEFQIDNQKITTSFYLDFIRLNIYNLKELENRSFEFPINPEIGFIDSSIYLFDVHNPIDVSQIEFSTIKNNSIDATLYFDIDFEYENSGYCKLNNCELKLEIQFGALNIDTEIMTAENFDEKTANELVSKFSDLNNYEIPQIIENQVIFKIEIRVSHN